MQQIQKDKLYFVLPDKIKLKYTSEEIAKSQKMRREVCYAETVLDEQATPPERIDKYEADKIASKKTKAKTQQELTQVKKDEERLNKLSKNPNLYFGETEEEQNKNFEISSNIVQLYKTDEYTIDGQNTKEKGDFVFLGPSFPVINYNKYRNTILKNPNKNATLDNLNENGYYEYIENLLLPSLLLINHDAAKENKQIIFSISQPGTGYFAGPLKDDKKFTLKVALLIRKLFEKHAQKLTNIAGVIECDYDNVIPDPRTPDKCYDGHGIKFYTQKRISGEQFYLTQPQSYLKKIFGLNEGQQITYVSCAGCDFLSKLLNEGRIGSLNSSDEPRRGRAIISEIFIKNTDTSKITINNINILSPDTVLKAASTKQPIPSQPLNRSNDLKIIEKSQNLTIKKIDETNTKSKLWLPPEFMKNRQHFINIVEKSKLSKHPFQTPNSAQTLQ